MTRMTRMTIDLLLVRFWLDCVLFLVICFNQYKRYPHYMVASRVCWL